MVYMRLCVLKYMIENIPKNVREAHICVISPIERTIEYYLIYEGKITHYRSVMVLKEYNIIPIEAIRELDGFLHNLTIFDKYNKEVFYAVVEETGECTFTRRNYKELGDLWEIVKKAFKLNK